MARHVFISHSSHDKETADTVCQFLENQGIVCWIAPRNVPPGARYGAAIVDAIEDALAIVFIFSEHSDDSEQVMNEIERSVSKRKPIFPLKISPIKPSSELEYFISRRHWLDMTNAPLDTILQQLADALHALPTTESPAVLRGPERLLVLEASREGERLKLSAYERGPDEERPLKHYEYQEVSFAAVEREVDSLMAVLNRVTNNRGTLDAAAWREIKAQAEILYHQLLTPGIRELLKGSTATHLLLHLDDTLVQIPWELLFDGSTFLCRRFSIGRLVSTQQALVAGKSRKQEQSLRILIIADPQGNLTAASREGDTLRRELASEEQRFQVDLRKTSVDTAVVKASLPQCDVVHYAGHADYNSHEPAQSGWLLADGKLTAAEILQISEQAPMPALVFCNACQSGHTTAWDMTHTVGQDVYGLANAFLLAGAQHYIGTLWAIPDEPSNTFAIGFYRALAHGATVGAALREARQQLVERYSEESVVWASYVLYGNPTSSYLETPRAPRSATPEAPSTSTATRGESVPRASRKLPLLVGVGTAAILILALAAWFGRQLWNGTAADISPLTVAYQVLEQGKFTEAKTLFQQLLEQGGQEAQSQGYAGLAAVALAQNDYQQTLNFARQAETIDPEIAYSHVLRGHVLFNQGKTAEAVGEYRTATEKAHGFPWQRTIAYNHLGRLYTDQGSPQQALEHYDKALSQQTHEPLGTAIVHANKGHLLAQLGKYQEALSHYQQAQQLTPNDPVTASLLRETERRGQLAADEERLERLDRLVQDLLQLHRQGQRRADSGDDWTSTPLTFALMSLETRGVLSRAGEADFLALRLQDTLQATGRITVVEREILDKILAELQLSASELVDPQVAVRVGRILAARLIATGTLTRLGAEAQLSLRVVETESTRLRAAVTEMMEPSVTLDRTIDKFAATLLQKLRVAYPLQGRLAQVTPEGVILNIGAKQGVMPGLTLQVFGKEEPIPLNGKVIGYNRPQVGLIEVTSVEAELARAKVLEQTVPLEQGWKVKEVQEP